MVREVNERSWLMWDCYGRLRGREPSQGGDTRLKTESWRVNWVGDGEGWWMGRIGWGEDEERGRRPS